MLSATPIYDRISVYKKTGSILECYEKCRYRGETVSLRRYVFVFAVCTYCEIKIHGFAISMYWHRRNFLISVKEKSLVNFSIEWRYSEYLLSSLGFFFKLEAKFQMLCIDSISINKTVVLLIRSRFITRLY